MVSAGESIEYKIKTIGQNVLYIYLSGLSNAYPFREQVPGTLYVRLCFERILHFDIAKYLQLLFLQLIKEIFGCVAFHQRSR